MGLLDFISDKGEQKPVEPAAGGTDFFPALGDRPVAGTVVDISRLRELKGIDELGGQRCARAPGLG